MNTTIKTVLAIVALACAHASSARAQDSAGGEEDAGGGTPVGSTANLGLVIGGKVGGGIGTGAVGATPIFELELGYALPPLDRAIEIFFAGQYSMPGDDGTAAEPDARLPGDGNFSYELTQQMLTLTLGALYRFDLGSDLVMVYGGLGGRAYLMKTQIDGEVDGQAFGENEETQTDFGLVLLAGLDVFVGPGALLGELSYGFAAVDGFVLRDTNVGSFALSVGYRFIL
jgi:hypothetical protein